MNSKRCVLKNKIRIDNLKVTFEEKQNSYFENCGGVGSKKRGACKQNEECRFKNGRCRK